MDVDVKKDLVNRLRPLGPTAVMNVFGLAVVYYEPSIQHSITNKVTMHFKTTSHCEEKKKKRKDV